MHTKAKSTLRHPFQLWQNIIEKPGIKQSVFLCAYEELALRHLLPIVGHEPRVWPSPAARHGLQREAAVVTQPVARAGGKASAPRGGEG
jgi:hypothetical protein